MVCRGGGVSAYVPPELRNSAPRAPTRRGDVQATGSAPVVSGATDLKPVCVFASFEGFFGPFRAWETARRKTSNLAIHL